MNWTKKLWRTLPIALVIVLATAAVTFAAPPKEVKITGTPTTDYPNPHKRDANVKVNFEYISDPDKVEDSTTVEAWLLDHATEAEVAWARKEIDDVETTTQGFINVTIPTDAPHGQLYDVKVIVRNSDGESEAVIEKGGADEKGAVIVDAEPPAKIGWVKMYKEGPPDEEVHSPINFKIPKFKWAATTDEGSKVEKYFWEVTNKVAAFAGDPTQEGEVDPVAGNTEYECGPVNTLVDGTYYFHVRAIDSVGNKSEPQTLKFVVDTIAPALTMEKPAEVGGTRWTTVKPTVEIKAVESGSGLDKASTEFKVSTGTGEDEVEIQGSGSWTGLVWTWTPNADLTGCAVYTVNMKVKDMAGNEAEQTWQFKVDDDEPTISGLVPDNDTWTNKPLKSDAVTSGYLTISATVADADGCPSGIDYETAQMWVDGHQIKLGDPNFESENGLVSYTPTKLRKGRNIPVKVEVKDHAGNVATAEWHFHYDPDTPELSEESPDTWTNNKKPVVSVKVKQTVSGLDLEACTFEVKKDGTKVDGTTKWNGDVWEWRPKDDLAECTEYTVTVKVTNNAGTEATKVWTFEVDTKAPKITPVSPLSTDLDDECWLKDSAAKPEIEAKLEDEGCAGINEKTIEMRINGQPVPKYVDIEEVDGWEYDETTGTLAYVYHGNNKLKDGWYIVTVDVEDNAGNAAKTAEWEFGVDTVKPVFSDGTPEEWVGTTKPVLTVKVVEETSGLDISKNEDGEFNTFSFVVVNKYADEIDGKGEWNGDVFTWTPDEELVEPRTYWVYVNGQDNAGNAAEEYSWFFTVDLTKPIIKNPTPEDKEAIWEKQEEVEISAEFEEWGSGIDVETAVMTVNGEEVEAVATLEDIKYTLEEPEDGRYIITVNVSDRAGNAADELKWEFYIDTTPPTDPGKPYAGNLGKDGNYYINTRRPVFYWAASVDQEPGSGLDKYKFQFGPKDEMPEPEEDEWLGAPISEDVEASEGATVEQYMHKWDVVLNVGAEYAARVKAYDIAGHGSSWVDDTTIIYDPDEPTPVTELRLASDPEDTRPAFTWEPATDAISGVAGYIVKIRRATSATWDVFNQLVECPEQGDNVVTWKIGFEIPLDKYYMSVAAKDAAGNEGDAAQLTFEIKDLTPPAVPEAPKTESPTKNRNPVWKWGAVEDAVKYRVYEDDDEKVVVTIPTYTSENLTEGKHTLRVSAIDAAGNESEKSEAGEVVIDLTPPVVPEAPVTESLTNNRNPVWTWAAVEDAVSYRVYENGVPKGIVNEPKYTSKNLTEGTHRLEVTAIDAVGNESAASEAGHVVIDLTPPVVPEAPVTESLTNNRNPVWTWAAVEDAVKYRVYEDDVDKGFVTEATYTSENLAEGEHTLAVTAIDAAGNESAKSEAGEVVIDLTPPVVPEAPVTESLTNNRNPMWTWAAVEDAVKYRVYEDDVDKGFVTEATYTSENLAEGEHTLAVTAIDAAGNESAKSEAGHVVILIPAVSDVKPNEGEYKINHISTIMFSVTGLCDADVEVTVNDKPIDASHIVEVAKTSGMAKFYVLLGADVVEPGTMVVTITVAETVSTHNYTVNTERSGFGFGRLRPW
jgi:hypothetical protein